MRSGKKSGSWSEVSIQTHGNVHAATGFLHGLFDRLGVEIIDTDEALTVVQVLEEQTTGMVAEQSEKSHGGGSSKSATG